MRPEAGDQMMETADLLLKWFRGRVDTIAVGDAAGFHPEQREIGAGLITDHLEQRQCYGFYLLTDDAKVWCSAVDFDNKEKSPDPEWQSKAERVYYQLANLGLSPVVEVSASGQAAHVWLFFDEPTHPWVIRAWWRALSAYLSLPFVEVYPRQDQFTGKGLGNLIRYPLWNQSHFVDVENEWQKLEPSEAFAKVKGTNEAELKMLAFEIGCGQLKPEQPLVTNATTGDDLPPSVSARLTRSWSLLARRWNKDTSGLNDASNSGLVQSIATELVRTYVPTPEIEVALRIWCKRNGYEKGEREDFIPRSIKRAYEFVTNRVEKKSMEGTTIDAACHAHLDELLKGVPQFVSSGIPEVDRSIDGLRFGQMGVVAARPSHGKSAFGMQWIDEAAKAGYPGLILSEEMAAIELGQRALLSISEIIEDDWAQNIATLRQDVNSHYESRAPIHVEESCATIDRCEELIDQYCGIHGVRFVVVDYLQLLSSRSGSRYEDVTDISKRLKQAAKRNNCAVLALAQLNRSIESRDSREPKMGDLRESGQIEQDADLVLFLVWPARFGISKDVNEFKIYAAKRRNGPIRTTVINTYWEPARQRFGRSAVVGDYDEVELQDYSQDPNYDGTW
jgi:replicative DNA helicase